MVEKEEPRVVAESSLFALAVAVMAKPLKLLTPLPESLQPMSAAWQCAQQDTREICAVVARLELEGVSQKYLGCSRIWQGSLRSCKKRRPAE
jgi:hypothetical protein